MRFIDTNIFIRHLTQDDPKKAGACTQLIHNIEHGKVLAWTSDLAIAETVFVPSSAEGSGYNFTRQEIQEGLLPILMLPGLFLPSRKLYPRVFALYTTHNIDFVDAYHAALVEASDPPELYSYDRDFDRVGTVKRLEPESVER